jgi:hypothetical protein
MQSRLLAPLLLSICGHGPKLFCLRLRTSLLCCHVMPTSARRRSVEDFEVRLRLRWREARFITVAPSSAYAGQRAARSCLRRFEDRERRTERHVEWSGRARHSPFRALEHVTQLLDGDETGPSRRRSAARGGASAVSDHRARSRRACTAVGSMRVVEAIVRTRVSMPWLTGAQRPERVVVLRTRPSK